MALIDIKSLNLVTVIGSLKSLVSGIFSLDKEITRRFILKTIPNRAKRIHRYKSRLQSQRKGSIGIRAGTLGLIKGENRRSFLGISFGKRIIDGQVYVDDKTVIDNQVPNAKPYAVYIHDGTRNWNADPFLADSVEHFAPRMKTKMVRANQKLIKERGFGRKSR